MLSGITPSKWDTILIREAAYQRLPREVRGVCEESRTAIQRTNFGLQDSNGRFRTEFYIPSGFRDVLGISDSCVWRSGKRICTAESGCQYINTDSPRMPQQDRIGHIGYTTPAKRTRLMSLIQSVFTRLTGIRDLPNPDDHPEAKEMQNQVKQAVQRNKEVNKSFQGRSLDSIGQSLSYTLQVRRAMDQVVKKIEE